MTITMTKEEEAKILNREPTLTLLIISILIGISAFINVYSVQSILPELIRDFNVSPVEAGATVGATILAVAIISPFMGMISDAFGRRGLVVLSVFFLSIPTAMIYFSSNVHEVVVWRFLQGVVVPGIAVVMMAYIGEEYRGPYMRKLMSFYIAGTILGGFLGRFIVGHLSEFVSWRQAYLIMAFMNLVLSIVVFAKLPKSRYFQPDRKFRHAMGMLVNHAKNRDIVAACVTGACILFSLVGTFTYVNIHLAAEPFHLSSGDLANIFAVYLLGVVITPVSARLINRIGIRKTIVFALVMSSIGLLITFGKTVHVVVLGLAVMSLGVFITQNSTVTFIATNVTEGRSLATGLYNMSYYFGGSLSAWLCGLAYESQGWKGAVAMLIVAQMVAAIVAWNFMKPKFATVVSGSGGSSSDKAESSATNGQSGTNTDAAKTEPQNIESTQAEDKPAQASENPSPKEEAKVQNSASGNA